MSGEFGIVSPELETRRGLHVGVECSVHFDSQCPFRPVSSDEPLLLELQKRYPDAEIWPRQIECGEGDDCMVAAGGVFDIGRWRRTDWDCVRERDADDDFDVSFCLEYFNWRLSGLFHPKYYFEWLNDEFEPAGRSDSFVLAGEVTALLGRKSGPALYLVQRGFIRPFYHLVEAGAEFKVVTTLTEYPLDCEKAPKNSWQRSGYRHHRGVFDVFVVDYCEIRDLKGFRNLARKALKRPPSAIWERVGDLPDDEEGSRKEAGGK